MKKRLFVICILFCLAVSLFAEEATEAAKTSETAVTAESSPVVKEKKFKGNTNFSIGAAAGYNFHKATYAEDSKEFEMKSSFFLLKLNLQLKLKAPVALYFDFDYGFPSSISIDGTAYNKSTSSDENFDYDKVSDFKVSMKSTAFNFGALYVFNAGDFKFLLGGGFHRDVISRSETYKAYTDASMEKFMAFTNTGLNLHAEAQLEMSDNFSFRFVVCPNVLFSSSFNGQRYVNNEKDGQEVSGTVSKTCVQVNGSLGLLFRF